MQEQKDIKTVDVAAGIVFNAQGQCLLSSRPEGKPYAGYWEFAGGKLEGGETALAALQREWREELGVEITRATPWLCKRHAYEHAHVRIWFFRVAAGDWHGELQAKEGQRWAWQTVGRFDVSPMLPANGPLLRALSFPTEWTGGLATEVRGCGERADWCLRPRHSAQPGGHVWLAWHEWAAGGVPSLAEYGSVWLLADGEAQVQAALAAEGPDGVIWRMADSVQAKAACTLLQEGCGLPLALAAPAPLCETFERQWCALGAQAVLRLDESELKSE